MKVYECEEVMYDGCVSRVRKGLDGAGIESTADLSVKIMTIDGGADYETRAVETLDDLGFTAVGV